jgi:hypothetical protein
LSTGHFSRTPNNASISVALRELARLEGLVVALERLLGAGDLGSDRAEALLDLGPVAFRFCLCSRKHRPDQVAVAVDAGELGEDGLLELCAAEPVVAAGLRPVFLAAGASSSSASWASWRTSRESRSTR